MKKSQDVTNQVLAFGVTLRQYAASLEQDDITTQVAQDTTCLRHVHAIGYAIPLIYNRICVHTN